MKNHILIILASIVALVFFCTSCLVEEKSDVIIDYAIEYAHYSGSSMDPMLETMRTAEDACQLALYASGLEMIGTSTLVLRDQRSNKEARKQAKNLGSSVDGYLGGFRPVVDVTIKINISSSFGEETVSTLNYKAK